jgi:tRNA threonylcarbamoyladenosine biosynthesis protein TsaE
MGIRLATDSADETRDMGATLAAILRPGDVVSLTGEPGAGKTSFVQGVGRGLGVTQQVVSPTFTLVREYDGSALRLYHLDVYRLTLIQEVIDLGFEEMVDSGGVTFVEWGDVIEGLLDGNYLQIEFTVPEIESDSRAIDVICAGASWAERMDALRAITGRWIAG